MGTKFWEMGLWQCSVLDVCYFTFLTLFCLLKKGCRLVYKRAFLPIFQSGEIDCWPLECPPTFCANPILKAGHCCPVCEVAFSASEDAYNLCSGLGLERGLFPNNNGTLKPCFHLGREYKSGQSWTLVDANQDEVIFEAVEAVGGHGHDCTSCECKVRSELLSGSYVQKL